MAAPPKRHRIGQNVRKLRLAAGLTQATLAERTGIADATLSRIERNRLTPSLRLAGQLAEALGVAVDTLMGPVRKLPKAKVRRSEARLLAVVRDLDDAQVDDVTKAVKLILAVGRRSAR